MKLHVLCLFIIIFFVRKLYLHSFQCVLPEFIIRKSNIIKVLEIYSEPFRSENRVLILGKKINVSRFE